MEKTKVLHIVGALNLGGAETMIMNIFRNIDRSRFQFDFYLSGNSGGFYEEEVLQLGGRIFNVGRRKKHPVNYCTELFKVRCNSDSCNRCYGWIACIHILASWIKENMFV